MMLFVLMCIVIVAIAIHEIRCGDRQIRYVVKDAAILVLLSAIIALLFSSCTRTVYVPITSTKTEYKYKAQKDSFNLINILNKRDSVYVRDSVVKRYNDKGELLSSEIWRWREKYSDTNALYKALKTKFDSISSIKQDTIRVPYSVDKEVKRPLNWYEKLCLWGFSLVLAGGIGYIIKKFIIK